MLRLTPATLGARSGGRLRRGLRSGSRTAMGQRETRRGSSRLERSAARCGPRRWAGLRACAPDAATGWSPLVGDGLELGVEVANAGAQPRDVKVETTLEHVRSKRRVEQVSAVETIASGEMNGVVEEGDRLLLEPQGNYE